MADAGVQTLMDEVEFLTRKIDRLESVNAIRDLQYKYGYYMDKGYYDETVDLFSERGAMKFLNGLYKGKAGARRVYCDWFRAMFADGVNGPTYGFLLDHLLVQGIIDELKKTRTVTVEEVVTAVENHTFKMPQNLQAPSARQ